MPSYDELLRRKGPSNEGSSYRVECAAQLKSLEMLQLLRDFHGGFLQTIRHGFVHMLDAHRVDSVPFRSGCVVFTVEYMAKVATACVANNLEAAIVRLHPNVALVAREETLVERYPPVVWELAVHAIKRILATTAAEEAGLGKHPVVFTRSGRLGTPLPQNLIFLSPQQRPPLFGSFLNDLHPSVARRGTPNADRARCSRFAAPSTGTWMPASRRGKRTVRRVLQTDSA